LVLFLNLVNYFILIFGLAMLSYKVSKYLFCKFAKNTFKNFSLKRKIFKSIFFANLKNKNIE
jgi:hypothetical protein